MNREAIIMLCRASRKAQNITLTALSHKIGCSPASLSRFERGHFNADYMNAYYINVLNDAEKDTLKSLVKSLSVGGL